MSDKDPLDLSDVEMKMPEENFFGEPEPPARSWFRPIVLIFIILILGSILLALLWFKDLLNLFTPVENAYLAPTETATTSEPVATSTATDIVNEPVFFTSVSYTEGAISTSTATSTATTSTPLPGADNATSTDESATGTATTTEET